MASEENPGVAKFADGAKAIDDGLRAMRDEYNRMKASWETLRDNYRALEKVAVQRGKALEPFADLLGVLESAEQSAIGEVVFWVQYPGREARITRTHLKAARDALPRSR